MTRTAFQGRALPFFSHIAETFLWIENQNHSPGCGGSMSALEKSFEVAGVLCMYVSWEWCSDSPWTQALPSSSVRGAGVEL